MFHSLPNSKILLDENSRVVTKQKFWNLFCSSRDLLAAGKNRRRWLVFQNEGCIVVDGSPIKDLDFAPFQLPIRKAGGFPLA